VSVITVVLHCIMFAANNPVKLFQIPYAYLYTWCAFEVPRMILLCHLKGAYNLIIVKACLWIFQLTRYGLNALTPVVWKLWLW